MAVRHWITYYGAYLNVCPAMGLFRLVRSDPLRQAPMSCLVAERCGPVRMTGVRSALVCRLAERFNCDRYHLYTGHPMLRRVYKNRSKDASTLAKRNSQESTTRGMWLQLAIAHRGPLAPGYFFADYRRLSGRLPP